VSKDYVADNAGTGFASFDDDGPSDLDSLLAGAALGEEPDDQDTSAYFGDSDQVAYTSQSEGLSSTSSSFQNSYAREESAPVAPVIPAPALQIDDDEEYDDLPADEPVAPVEQLRPRSWETDPNPTFSTPAPVQAPTPVAPAVKHAAIPEYSQPSSRRISIPSETDEIVLAGKVIRILDAYRKLNTEVRSVASQFITSGSEVIEDEATLVVKVINADPMLSVTMKSLREAKALDPVERVFYVISLEDDVLHSLGGLVSVFNGTALDQSQNRISYARALVREIEQLEARAVNYVESTESILAAADEESI
jgi:hypothetical protein